MVSLQTGACIRDAIAGLTTDEMLFRAANNIGVMHLMRTEVRVHKVFHGTPGTCCIRLF